MIQKDYESSVEPFLCEHEYVARRPSRIITEKGRKVLEIIKNIC